MIFNEQEVDDTDKILEGWKDYFSELYSTNNSTTFELEKVELVKLQNEILENSEKNGTPIEMATLEEIQTVIRIRTLYYCSYCTILKNSLSNLLGFYQYHLLLAH
jgi:hypothetical protein